MTKNLQSRLLVGFVGVFLILFANFLHPSSFTVVFLFFWSLSVLELIQLIDPQGYYRLIMLFLSILIGLLYKASGVAIPYQLILLIWISPIIISLFHPSPTNFQKSIFFPIYVTIPYFFLILIRTGPLGSFWILFVLLSVWILDIFSYFTGMLIGKHSVAPRISPKKTVEGLLGGLFFSGLFIFFFLRSFTNASLLQIVLIALSMPLTGFLGDLYESLIKRRAGIKDSGDLLAGHGGFLDRFDSILFVAVLFIFYQQVLHWL